MSQRHECAGRALLGKAETHWRWRREEKAWRLWIRWMHTQRAEAAARAHQAALQAKAMQARMADTHFRTVAT